MIENVILDLDETLISACDYEYYVKEHKNFDPKYKNKDDKNLLESIDMDKDYVVYCRPHLQEFLKWLFQNYKVSVWTAASKSYAMFIIENIILKPIENDDNDKRKLQYAFFSYHCEISTNLTGNTKKLSILSEVFKLPDFTKDNTLIIDDYIEVKKSQPDVCLRIKGFNFIKDGCENDIELVTMQQRIKDKDKIKN